MDMENTAIDENDVEIEKSKLYRMIKRIYKLERENTKTKKYTIKEIKAAIERIIEEEAKTCY